MNGALYIGLSLILVLLLTAAGSLLGGMATRVPRGRR